MKATFFFIIVFLPVALKAQMNNCKFYESVTAWVAVDTGDSKKHFLYGGPGGLKAYSQCNWVYADHRDVNNNDDSITHLVYQPCGGTKVEIEARICETCLRHETRNRTFGMVVPDYTESRYMQLLKGILKSKN